MGAESSHLGMAQAINEEEAYERRPVDSPPVSSRSHGYQDIVDGLDLADHMASSHGVDPDYQGWPRHSLLNMHRTMHS
jgi:hypothetical protein